MTEGPKKTVSVLVPGELYQELAEQAERSSRSMSAYIRLVLKMYLQYLRFFANP